jgi:hypothetical protein
MTGSLLHREGDPTTLPTFFTPWGGYSSTLKELVGHDCMYRRTFWREAVYYVLPLYS